MFPTLGIKISSHVDSKIKLKWDDEKQMIECERQAFDAFCLGHSKAKGIEVEDVDDAIDDLEITTVNLGDEVLHHL
ncbi:hypothetical protein V2J09_022180 [Rumex salicifolius]